jgi:hypothetical protein
MRKEISMKVKVVLLFLGLALLIFCVKDLEVVQNLSSMFTGTVSGKEVIETIEPSEGIVSAAILRAVKEDNHDNTDVLNYIIDKKVITNKYTLERNGETVFCYHFKCSYHVEEIPGVPCGMTGSIQIVKRGNAWYEF